ncbi:2-amino-4-hydroxy-6-hydroxymethyldihydropteridine diphosphokinase [Prevotella sp. Rep29]|jgi:2-amino-4-hydroxy-6-hydroxymethyldihydropteridine diphosphokinase|uniref:2-amino-4-hydroxy-6- hydroxymethyldihydropteridine diphosphokinase n=1 Tax=Prevotella sp. Rep29 TaxID=2691580 RepID=UPI001C6DED3E|nr:2-amino-4-hydroxy-6-hydroxymethyldihydropteridine diphosphokinase [Prevotella sp. Rep29]QYR10544.1 2-amino-4-hydroxy-6-hydroxymethyldihydropteridine pyrophosphokinase [Prevotella sp. Rep29]
MNKTHELIISIGTNVDHDLNMTLAKRALLTLLPDMTFTTEKWTNPVDAESDKFLNCLALATTRHGAKQIVRAFKQIERKCGDTKGKRSKGTITVDIDILKYDDEIFHKEDWQRGYIRALMREINEMKRQEKEL